MTRVCRISISMTFSDKMLEEKSDRLNEGGDKLLNPAPFRKRSASGLESLRSAGDFPQDGAPPGRPLAKKAHLEAAQQQQMEQQMEQEQEQEQEQSEVERSNRELLHFLTFPNKLWRIVNCDTFESLRWDSGGIYLVIDVETFQKEFLDSKEHPRIFETNNMRSFVRQLNLYGFRKVNYAQERCEALSAFLAEENQLSRGNKLLFFYNPNFQRGCEHRLQHVTRRVGIKAAKMEGRPGKPGAASKAGGKRTIGMCLQDVDQAAHMYGGFKSEVSSTWRSPSPPNSETVGSAWANQAPAQNQDVKSEGAEPEADLGIFSSHLLACVCDLSRSLLQVISALTEATSHQPQDCAVHSEKAQFQAMISSWMSLCNTCLSLPLITALFLKQKTMRFASQSSTDCFPNSEATRSSKQP